MAEEKLNIHTIQSYFVFETERFYQKVVAENGISHFYSFASKESKDKYIPLMADGCSNLVFEYSSHDVKSYFIGNTVDGTEVRIRNGCEYFGIRFEPGANPFLSNQEVRDLTDQTIPLEDFSILKDLTRKMENQSTFTTRMCTFMEEYRSYLHNAGKEENQLFMQMVKLIVKKDGILKINTLEKLSGYSNRYINLLFETNLGCSAKQFCQTVRMHTIVNAINREKVDSLVKFGNRFQFYDQSHFVHAFKNFTGITPTEYIQIISNQDYGSKVLNHGQDF